VAVLPRSTTAEKIRLIEREGGTCHLVTDPSKVDTEARRIAGDIGGHYLNQFTYAERATDWRSENNIAAEIYRQLSGERYPLPEWVVVGAGTGGTSTTIGRYVRLRHFDTRVLVVDPDHSAFFESWTTGNTDARANGSAIEGIGRPCWEPSFVLSTVDRMMSVPDASSIAAMRLLRDRTGLVGGGSSGTALFGALRLIDEMHREGVAGSIVSILCDRGDRYATTCYDDVWVREQGWDINTPMARLESFLTTGYWS
jgi:cysteine synthase A